MSVATVIMRVRDEASAPLADIADEAVDADRALTGATAQADKMSAASTSLGRILGLTAGQTKMLAGGGLALASGVGVAAAALLTLAASGAAAVVGLGAVVLHAEEAMEALKPFKDIKGIDVVVTPAALAGIRQATDAVGALRSILDALIVVLSNNAAPAIAKVAAVTVGLALAGLEAVESFAKGHDIMFEFAKFMLGTFYGALMGPLVPLQAMTKGLIYLAEAAGVTVPDGVKKAADTFANLQYQAAGATLSALGYVGASEGLSEWFDGFEAKGAAFIARHGKIRRALEDTGKAAEDAGKKGEASAAQMENAQRVEVVNWFDAQLAAIEALKKEFDSYTFLPQLEEEIAALTESTAASMAGFTRDLRRVATQARAGRATEAIGRVSSLSGLVGASPVGGAVMAGIGLVADAGKGGGIIPEVQTLLTDFTKGLTVLPDMITGGVKMLVEQIIPGLIDVLPDAIRGIIGALGTALPQLMNSVLAIFLDPKFWLDVGKAIIGGILDALKGLVGNIFGNKEKTGIFQKNGAIAQSIQERRAARGYASGLDYVGQTGVAVIHEGEEIVRRGGSMSMASKSRAGGNLTLILNGVLTADRAGLMAEIREAIRQGDSL